MPHLRYRLVAHVLLSLPGLSLANPAALAAQPAIQPSAFPEVLATAPEDDPASSIQSAASGPPAPATGAPTKQKTPLHVQPAVVDLDFSRKLWVFHGYVQADAAIYDQPPAGPLDEDFRRGAVGSGDDHARKLIDGVMPRRARIGGEGEIGDNIAYRAMLELNSHDSQGKRNVPHLAEVWVSYTRFAPYVIMAGAFPEPANMEDATNSDSLLFLERATAADFARSLGAGEGRIGVTLKRTDKRWFAALSLTGPTLDAEEEFPPSAAIVGRVSHALVATPDRSVHLGASGTYVLASSGKRPPDVPTGIPLRFQNTPEVDVDPVQLIDTGDIQASHANILGLEFAAQQRNFFLQSEGFRFEVDRGAGIPLPAAHFYGFYVEGSWILTGERRRFDPSRASFWFPKPDRPFGKGGWGAWELAFRYSQMDLNDNPGLPGLPPPPGGIRGGDQKIFALGLNWYPRNHLRFLLDYMWVSVNRLNPASALNPEPFGPPPETPPVGVQIGQRLRILAIRARYSF
jgi:phosphate-selective porin OprO/OprP